MASFGPNDDHPEHTCKQPKNLFICEKYIFFQFWQISDMTQNNVSIDLIFFGNFGYTQRLQKMPQS